MSLAELDNEWARVETLTEIVAQTRQSDAPREQTLITLRTLQADIYESRERGSWQQVSSVKLPPLSNDILACVIGAEISPRIAAMYQLLHGRHGVTYPTLQILQELLGLGANKLPELYESVSDDSPLVQANLVECDGEGPQSVIKPTVMARNRLLGITSKIPESLARRVSTQAHWGDLVLPLPLIDRLKDFIAHIQHRNMMETQWKAKGLTGPVSLFSGPSGTGKTLAASVIATALGWPLYRVDISKIVSKYIGETEKKISALFKYARNTNIVLLFDEADALFAKRGKINRASDRYANQQASHLLSCIDTHTGPCILTTNLRSNFDTAFTRRFQSILTFPHTQIQARKAIWALHMPSQAPYADDIDWDAIAKHAQLNGGNIRSAAQQAIVTAARLKSPINMAGICRAIWLELQKEGRAISRTEIGPLADFLEQAA